VEKIGSSGGCLHFPGFFLLYNCWVVIVMLRVYNSLCYVADVPLRITGLKPTTHYLLRVRAVNDVGAGTPVVRSELTENIRTIAFFFAWLFWLFL